ncbi:hypothetical protein R3W88_011558 [Solanum pinnatisectum]|uniref:Uncharacterized protein n=1 Tax=Solanum pinnatisectum TaxID=50273 RepID=A0AAV9LA47_9SOLN|nr:hypothetical protein R3W88_011558 [Solanum pinnatisectum]
MWQSYSQPIWHLVLGNLHRGIFELKQGMIQILHSNGQFTGLPCEDPQIHLRNFLDITDTYILTGVSSGYVRLMLFLYSLLGAARRWLDSEPPNSITTWDYLANNGAHETEQCEANPNSVNYLGNVQRGGVQQNYGNTYNPSWGNHPNFSWGGNQNQNQAQGANQYRSQGAGQQYQNPNQGVNPSTPKGGMTNEELLQKLMTEIGTKLNARIDKHDENIRNNQMSQMSLEKQVAQVANSLNLLPQGRLPGDTEPNPKQLHAVSTRSELQLEELAPKKRDELFSKFLSLLKQVHINMPLVDILQGIPKYAKYVKDIVASKRGFMEYETVALTEECSSRIQNRLPKKLKDPEDVLVQVGSLIFLVDFVVLDFEPDFEVPFILGRSFLAMGRALINVAASQLTMRALEKVEVFDVYHTLKLPSIYEELSAITVVDQIVESQVVVPDDPLEKVLIGYEVEGDTEAQEIETCSNLALVDTRKPQAESLDRELGPPPKQSIEQPPKLEIKTLPAHLRYAYLGTNETLPVILSAELSELQVDATLRGRLV